MSTSTAGRPVSAGPEDQDDSPPAESRERPPNSNDDPKGACPAPGEELLDEVLDSGDEQLEAFALAGLALARADASTPDRAALAARSVATFSFLCDRWGLAFALSVLGRLACESGDKTSAVHLHTRALAIAQEIRAEHLEVQLLDMLQVDAGVLEDVSPAAHPGLPAEYAEAAAGTGQSVGCTTPAVPQRRRATAATLTRTAGGTREVLDAAMERAVLSANAWDDAGARRAVPQSEWDDVMGRGRARPCSPEPRTATAASAA